jgi:hypothetical protein
MGVWYYDSDKTTFWVSFSNGAASSVSPADFDLASLKPRPARVTVAPPSPPSPPRNDAIARCRDGSYVLVAHSKGLCYGYGGVAEVLQK